MKLKNKPKLKKFFTFNVLFWLCFIALMGLLFFLNRNNISKTVAKVKDSPPISKPEISKIINNEIKSTIEKNSNASKQNERDDVKNDEKKEEIEALDKTKENKDDKKIINDERTYRLDKDVEDDIERVVDSANNKDETKNVAKRDIELYFVCVDNSGIVSKEKCIRTIEKSMSPMKDSITALLQGPTKEEIKKGLRSFIPVDTRLLSINIKNEIATIDLSEEFQFNRYGIEGYNIQLQQLVFTACTFPTVKAVQFLIEGQKRDFIGSEGVWIGSPLSVTSF